MAGEVKIHDIGRRGGLTSTDTDDSLKCALSVETGPIGLRPALSPELERSRAADRATSAPPPEAGGSLIDERATTNE
jgi:hypothetical protein